MEPHRLHGTVQSVLLGPVHSNVPPRPVVRQSFSLQVGSCRLGGTVYVHVLLKCSYDPPPEGHPGQLAYSSVIRIHPINVSHQNFNIISFCCYSRYLSLWLAFWSQFQGKNK